jgi:hypothetical protein
MTTSLLVGDGLFTPFYSVVSFNESRTTDDQETESNELLHQSHSISSINTLFREFSICLFVLKQWHLDPQRVHARHPWDTCIVLNVTYVIEAIWSLNQLDFPRYIKIYPDLANLMGFFGLLKGPRGLLRTPEQWLRVFMFSAWCYLLISSYLRLKLLRFYWL